MSAKARIQDLRGPPGLLNRRAKHEVRGCANEQENVSVDLSK